MSGASSCVPPLTLIHLYECLQNISPALCTDVTRLQVFKNLSFYFYGSCKVMIHKKEKKCVSSQKQLASSCTGPAG